LYHASVRPSPPLVLMTLLGSGCQFVFGLGDYEAAGGNADVAGAGGGAGGIGAAGAGPSTGGEGASGGDPSTGAGPTIWTVVGLPDVGDASSALPDTCVAGGERVNLFGGASGAECVPCDATPAAGSCQADLLCYPSSNNCQNEAPQTLSPGPSCTDIGAFNSCGASAQSAAACDVTGGEIAPGDTGLDRYASFCPCVDCAASCAVAEGNVGVAACDALLPHAYLLFAARDVEAECSECTAEASCAPKVFDLTGDGVFCTLPAGLDAGTCLSTGAIFDWRAATRLQATTCSAASTSVTATPVGQAWTVCCSEPLPAEFETQKL
jgi:hypothetical protein